MERKAVLLTIIEFLIAVSISIISLRGFLFVPGFYAYADQHWPLSALSFPSGVYALSPIYGFNFTRLIVTWPYGIITVFTSDVNVISRLFTFYTFVLFTSLSYVFANLLVKEYSVRFTKLSAFKSEIAKLLIVVFIFSNFFSINSNADGGAFSDSLIIILISISVLLILSKSANLKTYALIAAIFSITILLDPDFSPEFYMAVISSSVVIAVLERRLRFRFIGLLVFLALSVIPILFLLSQFYLMGTPGIPVSYAGGFRPFNLTSLMDVSNNINWYTPLLLLGYFWSTLAISPPTVLLYGHQLYSLPTIMNQNQILFPSGEFTVLWFIAMCAIPVFSLSSLFARRFLKFTSAWLMLVILGDLFANLAHIDMIFHFISYLSGVPLIGSAITTSFALPEHFIGLIAAGYYGLFSVTVLQLLSYKLPSRTEDVHLNPGEANESIKKKSRIKDRVQARKIWLYASRALVILIAFFVLTSGWQAFNGTYYPMRYSPSSFPIGNSIEAKGALAPTNISPSVVHAFNIVVQNSSSKNVMWIGGPATNEFTVELPSSAVSLSTFSVIAGKGLYNDAYQYLISHSVGYIVITNQDIQSMDGRLNPFTQYGFENYNGTVSFFLKIKELSIMYQGNQTIVFRVPGVHNDFYKSNLLLSTHNSDISRPYSYSIFGALGYNVSFTPDTGNNISSGIGVISPAELRSLNIVELPKFRLPDNFTNQAGAYFENSRFLNQNITYIQNNMNQNSSAINVGPFSTVSEKGSSLVNFSKGAFRFTSLNNSSSETLLYGGTGMNLSNNVSPQSIWNRTYSSSFSYTLPSNFSGKIDMKLIYKPGNASNFQAYRNVALNNRTGINSVQINGSIPADSTFFGYKILISNYNQTVVLENLNFTYYNFCTLNESSFFGNVAHANGVVFQNPTQNTLSLVVLPGNKSSQSNPMNYTILSLSPGLTETLDNNTRICAAIEGNISSSGSRGVFYSIYNGYYSRAILITDNGSVMNNLLDGSDGSHIFIYYGSASDVKVTANNLLIGEVALGYIGVVTFTIVIISLNLTQNIRPRKKKDPQ